MTTALANMDETPTLVRQAQTDQQLIDLWLHGRSCHTQRAYESDARRLLAFTSQPLHRTTLLALQAFADHLAATALEPASQHRILSSIKSLFAFGHRLGYLPFDVGRPLRLPHLRDALAERIMDEGQVHSLLGNERNPRNAALLYFLYAAGARVSEVAAIRWRDLQARSDGGQATIFGKGGKTRAVLIPATVWRRVQQLRTPQSTDDGPVFRSRRGGHLHPTQIRRLVKAAARRAGLSVSISPHWFRHAHASHALERGAPISLVQATLGHSSISTTGLYLHARPNDSSARFLPL